MIGCKPEQVRCLQWSTPKPWGEEDHEEEKYVRECAGKKCPDAITGSISEQESSDKIEDQHENAAGWVDTKHDVEKRKS